MDDELLRVSGLRKDYPVRLHRARALLRAVRGVSLSVDSGQTLGLVGESGSGKTTVGRCILRLVEPSTGEIFFHGRDVARIPQAEFRHLRPKMQVVFQEPYDSLDPRVATGAAIAEPLRLWTRLSGAERKDRVEALARSVGLQARLLERLPHELSAGNAQRVAIARALATEPELLVLDEPTSALDALARAEIIELLGRIQREQDLAYLFISHDLHVIRHLSSRVNVMYLGTIVEAAPTEELFANPLHPYTRALLSALLVADPSVPRSRYVLAGEIPSPINVPPGCPLYTRCPLAVAACNQTVPELRDVGGHHAVACIRVPGYESAAAVSSTVASG
jgi:oligopeptide/dipeptide ABC transporter ATP-binding protein